jgi:hypothetical protein
MSCMCEEKSAPAAAKMANHGAVLSEAGFDVCDGTGERKESK